MNKKYCNRCKRKIRKCICFTKPVRACDDCGRATNNKHTCTYCNISKTKAKKTGKQYIPEKHKRNVTVTRKDGTTSSSNEIITQEIYRKEYLKSEHWLNKRKEYWYKGRYRKCYVCSKPWESLGSLDLHHRTYVHLGNEPLDDLVPVCRTCHEVIHVEWNQGQKTNRRLLQITEKHHVLKRT